MSITTNSINGLSPSFDSTSQASNDNTSVMYYLIAAMMSQLDCCKQCIDKDKDFQFKQAIEQQLQSMDSISAKKHLLDYLKASMKDCDKELKAWIEGLDSSVSFYQEKIDDSIAKYQKALKNLNKKFLRQRDYLPKDIREQFESLEKQIQDLIDKSNYSTKDLETLQSDFKQLFSIAQKQIEKNPFYKAFQWLHKETEKAFKDYEGHYNGFFFRRLGDALAIAYFKIVANCSPLGLYSKIFTNPIYKAEENFGKKGEAITNVNLTVNNLVNNTVRCNLKIVEQILQTNSKAKEEYEDSEKQIENLSEILGQSLENNKV